MAALGKLTLTLVIGSLLALLRAWVLSLLWRWFATPLGVGALGMAHAYGMLTLVQLLTTSAPPKPKKDAREDPFGEVIIYMVMMNAGLSLFALLFGWIARGLM